MQFIAEIFAATPGFAQKLASLWTPEGRPAALGALHQFGADRIRSAVERAIVHANEERRIALLSPIALERLHDLLSAI